MHFMDIRHIFDILWLIRDSRRWIIARMWRSGAFCHKEPVIIGYTTSTSQHPVIIQSDNHVWQQFDKHSIKPGSYTDRLEFGRCGTEKSLLRTHVTRQVDDANHTQTFVENSTVLLQWRQVLFYSWESLRCWTD